MPVTGGNTSTVMSQIPPRACAGLGCQFAVYSSVGVVVGAVFRGHDHNVCAWILLTPL